MALRIFKTYEERLRAANAVDFEDLILLVARLLEKPGGEGDRIRRRYDYVLVDEFQDTNAIQYRFLRDLVRDHRNLCVVGDDDQSIYRWRGADVRNIRHFRRDYPDANVVKLEQELPLHEAHRRRRAGGHLPVERAGAQGSCGRPTTTGSPSASWRRGTNATRRPSSSRRWRGPGPRGST